MFLAESPEFSIKNPFISISDLEEFKVIEDHKKANDKSSLYHLQQVWLNSIEDETAGLLLEENRNTLNALDSLIKKQDGIDEEDSLMRSLAFVLDKKILNMRQFKTDQRNKELLAAEQKNKYKG